MKKSTLVLHDGQLDVDHIIPRADEGPDEENNFALTHSTCNKWKGASDLRVARRMAEFDQLQKLAVDQGERGANLGHVLARHEGSKANLKLKRSENAVEYVLSAVGDQEIHRAAVYTDTLSGMSYFFTLLPLEYLHHDDRINPRSIGANIRGLIEEFLQKRPQLHIALAWWSPDNTGAGPVKVFDGQHKAAAQVMLGVRKLPVRVFLDPDTKVLLTANTNAGSSLRQVAFDVAMMRHLGSSLFTERLRQYQQLKGLAENDYGFSEKDLVAFFKGEHREMLRYVVDSVRDSVTHNKDNRLVEFIEWSGNSILIKLNQIGTLTETLDTIELAQQNSYNCFISHRSGETEDTTISDLTVATGAGHIKAGSGCRSERVAKFNQFLRIERQLGRDARFAGRKAFKR